MKTLLFLLLCYIPSPSFVEEIYVEKIELNHFYNKRSGNLVLSQYILYKHLKLSNSNGYRVVNWFRLEQPIRRENEYYTFYLYRGDKTYKLKTRIFREIKSDYDRELVDRELLSEDNRPAYIP